MRQPCHELETEKERERRHGEEHAEQSQQPRLAQRDAERVAVRRHQHADNHRRQRETREQHRRHIHSLGIKKVGAQRIRAVTNRRNDTADITLSPRVHSKRFNSGRSVL